MCNVQCAMYNVQCTTGIINYITTPLRLTKTLRIFSDMQCFAFADKKTLAFFSVMYYHGKNSRSPLNFVFSGDFFLKNIAFPDKI